MKNKYLTFCVGEQDFCLDVKDIVFVKKYENEIENISEENDSTLSIFKYREKVIPLLNPKQFLLSKLDLNKPKFVIILEKNTETNSILVNQVSTIIEKEESEIHEKTPFSAKFVKGFLEYNNKLITIVDLDETLIFKN